MNTFTLKELSDVLIKRDAFIYHGAGFAKGSGNSHTNSLSFTQRLQNVINEDLEICCSTVRKGDCESNHNYWGKMGLILKVNSHNSVTLVSHEDAGTEPDPSNYGRRIINRIPISIQDVKNSIDLRNDIPNEWCILNYSVYGIFVEPPIQYTEGENLYELQLKDVFHHFPDLKVYIYDKTFTLVELLPSLKIGGNLQISEIY